MTAEARIEMATRCRDADALPRVPGAGQVVDVSGTPIQVMHNGIHVLAGGYYGGWMSDLIRRCRGVHEPQEEPVFAEVLRHMRPGAAMIELGAFWAFYALWFLQGDPARRAILLEPDPNHIAVGARNVQLNRHWLDPARLIVRQGFAGAGDGGPQSFATETAGVLDLPQMTVPQLMAEAGLERLDLVHCDVQGHEAHVLAQCMDLFRDGAIRFAMISTHSHHISGDPLTHQRCLALIEEAGGRVLAQHDVHESFSGDGLIAAYFGREALDWRAPPMSYNRSGASLFRHPLYDLAEAEARCAALAAELAAKG